MNNATSWQQMLSEPEVGGRIVQVYRGENQLMDTVSHYIAEGLRKGEAVIVIATAAHWALLVGRLVSQQGFELVDAVMQGQLRIMDADVTLAAMMFEGMPQKHQFLQNGGDIISRAGKRHPAVRVYGELSDILWQSGKLQAAGCIEECWSELMQRYRFSLLCAYRVDDFGTAAYFRVLDVAGKTNAQLLPRFDGIRQGTLPGRDSEIAAA